MNVIAKLEYVKYVFKALQVVTDLHDFCISTLLSLFNLARWCSQITWRLVPPAVPEGLPLCQQGNQGVLSLLKGHLISQLTWRCQNMQQCLALGGILWVKALRIKQRQHAAKPTQLF